MLARRWTVFLVVAILASLLTSISCAREVDGRFSRMEQAMRENPHMKLAQVMDVLGPPTKQMTGSGRETTGMPTLAYALIYIRSYCVQPCDTKHLGDPYVWEMQPNKDGSRDAVVVLFSGDEAMLVATVKF